MTKYAKLSIGMIALFSTSLAAAGNFSVPVVNLGGVIVNHAVGAVNSKSIPLAPLSDYGDLVRWNISCDYKIQENGGAAAPSQSNPMVVNITIDEFVKFYGTDFGGEGFTSSSGTIKSNRVLAFSGWQNGHTTSIQFDNYDATGDLIVSNCTATLVAN